MMNTRCGMMLLVSRQVGKEIKHVKIPGLVILSSESLLDGGTSHETVSSCDHVQLYKQEGFSTGSFFFFLFAFLVDKVGSN